MRAQSVDVCFTGIGDQRRGNNSLEIYDVAVGIESGSGGEIVAVPLGHCFGNKGPAEQGDGEVLTIRTLSTNDGWRDGSEACASVSLKSVSVIIASGCQKNRHERKDAHRPKPLHENSLLCRRACSGNPLSQTTLHVTAMRSTAEVRCVNCLAR